MIDLRLSDSAFGVPAFAISALVLSAVGLAQLTAALAIAAAPLAADEKRVTCVPEAVRVEFSLAPFYKKFVSAGGVPDVHLFALGSARRFQHSCRSGSPVRGDFPRPDQGT